MKEYLFFMDVDADVLPAQIKKLQETNAFVQMVEIVGKLKYRITYTDITNKNYD